MKKSANILLACILYLCSSAQNVGVGTSSPTQKLDIVGNLKVSGAIMPGGTAGTAGQVLVSNGSNAAPTWETIGTTGGKILVKLTENSNSAGRQGFSTTSGGAGQVDSIDLNTIEYNIGTDFTINTGTPTNNYIQVNSTGLYHFEGVINFFVSQTTGGLAPQGSLFLNYTVPGVGNKTLTLFLAEILPQTDFTSPFFYFKSIKFNFDFYFLSGSTITLRTQLANLSNFPLSSIGIQGGSYIAAYKISD